MIWEARAGKKAVRRICFCDSAYGFCCCARGYFRAQAAALAIFDVENFSGDIVATRALRKRRVTEIFKHVEEGLVIWEASRQKSSTQNLFCDSAYGFCCCARGYFRAQAAALAIFDVENFSGDIVATRALRKRRVTEIFKHTSKKDL